MSLARTTGTWAFAHFAVDFACIGSVMAISRALGPALGMTAILAYDAVAFCLQLPLGSAADRWGKPHWAPASSLALTLAGVAAALACQGELAGREVPQAVAQLSVALLASGNALFHVTGGVEVLDASPKAGPAGAFVSTGALGVFLGAALAGTKAMAPAAATLLVASALLLRHPPHEPGGVATQAHDLPRPNGRKALAVVLICTTVGLRSLAGTVMGFPWKAGWLALAAALAVVAGKAAGGVLADRRGFAVASVASLAGSAVLFPLGWDVPAAGLMATLLFNGTMAVTLVALCRVIAPSRGTAFGACSFSLAVGALPGLLGLVPSSPHVLVGLSLASLVTLLGGLALGRPE